MTFDTFADTWECQEVPHLPRKTTLQLAVTPWARIGFATSPRTWRGRRKTRDSRGDTLEHQNNVVRKNTRRDTSRVYRVVPATWNDDGGRQSAAPATKTATHLLKATQKYCACHTQWLLTRYETCWNVTNCHPQSPDPQSETGTLATHSGRKIA